MQLVVIGMHRSGTSAITRMINMLGVYFAPEGVSTGANIENPKGFWERKDIRSLNDELLFSLNSDWHKISNFDVNDLSDELLSKFESKATTIIREMDANRPWVIKEPRFCILFDVWKKLLEVPVCIFVYRDPFQIANSLKKRNNLSIQHGIAMWEYYNLSVLNSTKNLNRILVSYNDLMEKPMESVKKLFGSLKDNEVNRIALPSEREVLGFLDNSLWRNREKYDSNMDLLSDAQKRLNNAFLDGTVFHDDWPIRPDNRTLEILKNNEKIITLKDEKLSLNTQLEKANNKILSLSDEDERLSKRVRNLDGEVVLLKKRLNEAKFTIKKAEINEDKRLKKFEEKIVSEQQLKSHIDQCLVEIEKSNYSSKLLRKYINDIDSSLKAFLGSRRWKFGNNIVKMLNALTFRNSQPIAILNIEDLIKKSMYTIANSKISSNPKKTFIEDFQQTPAITVDIIICVHNALEDFKRCIDSVTRYTDLSIHNVIIIDDGSDNETKAYVAKTVKKLKATHLRNRDALGYTIAANIGLRISKSDFSLLLNSDTVVTPFWLDRLIRCATISRNAAVVGPLSNAASWQSIPKRTDENGKWIVNELPTGVDLKSFSNDIATKSARLYPEVKFINGFCYLIRRSVLSKIGYLDEKSFPKGYGEEDDFSIRCTDAGFGLYIADDVYIYHAKSKSFGSKRREKIVGKSKNQLIEKYGKKRINSLVTKMRENEKYEKSINWLKLNLENTNTRNLITVFKDKSPRIGWIQPHLNCVGGIRRTIEMANRLKTMGAHPTLITPEGIKPSWLLCESDVVKEDEAKNIHFDFLILSDPDMVKTFNSISSNIRICYHLAAYMLYRNSNKDLREFYSLPSTVVHIANSKWTADHVTSYSGTEVEGVFPGGVDLNTFHPVRTMPDYDIVCYGSARQHKGTHEINSASENLSILKLADINPPQEKLSNFISSGRVFVSACHHEGFNFCPIEAMACGVPVVMTDCGGSREYARNGENALVVPPKDIVALRTAINTVLNDKRLRIRLVENGFQTAMSFNWNEISISFGKFLAGLL